jgi:hypothetical protein
MADSSIQIPTFLPEKPQKPRGRNLELVGERTVEQTPIHQPGPETLQISQASVTLAAREMVVMRKEADLRTAAVTINTGLRALGQRSMTLIALLATGGMFVWSVLEPTPLRLASACLCAVLVLLPLAWLDARRE